MNIIFQDTLPPSLNSSAHSAQASATTTSQAFCCTSRQFVDQLKRFIQVNESPSVSNASSSSLSLSDVGFLLLRLKDRLLSPDQRGAYFPAEFVARPYNGIDILVKVVVALQNVVNSVGSSSKLSSLLTRTNSSANRRRKAAVAEADCIECIKILLEKTPSAWRSLLEIPANLDVILYSVHSPQLDSKCYALEIIILLLDQPHGFHVLFRSLSYIAARNRDYLRLSLFISQLKHGLHTSKLHIQILVVRLLNKLLQQAPSSAHRIMAQTDAVLSNFSPEYLEKLVIEATTPLGGMEILMEEIAIWKSLYTPIIAPRNGLSAVNQHDPPYTFTYAEGDTDTTRSECDRRRLAMKLSGQTSVTKNVERQRLKRHGEGYGFSTHLPSRIINSNGNTNSYNPSQTKTWDGYNAYPQTRFERVEPFQRPEFGEMRRAKSESAMLIEDETFNRYLKQNGEFPSSRHGELTSKLSRSIHDLSRDQILTEAQSGSTTMTRSLRRKASPPRTRFADPLVNNKAPIQGFSYLFPSQPIISNVATKQRARTPDAYKDNESERVSFNGPQLQRPPSAPVFDSPRSPDYSTNAYSAPVKTNGQLEKVVYIPINGPNDGQIRTLPRTNTDGSTNFRRYDYKRQPESIADDYSAGSRSSSTSRLRSPGSYAGTIGDDVKDALSQFDYLNDYEASTIKGMTNTKCTPTTYHF